MIIIWNTKTLKEKLVSRELSDNHAFIYFFVVLVYDYLGFTFGYLGLNGQEPNLWIKTNVISALALTFFGILYVFWCNGASKGEQFFHRYFSFSLVVGIKFAILMLLIPTAIDFISSGEAYKKLPWLGTVIFVSLNIAMFLFIGRHMRDIARYQP